MDFFTGIRYNLRGLWVGIKTPRLCLWGAIRFIAVILITFLFAGLILAYHQEILDLMWSRPESQWVLWLWHLLSWLLSLFLMGLSVIISYLISQVLFSVFIMDLMSRITELKVTGNVIEPDNHPLAKQLFHLIRQEIPRAVIPVFLSILLMVLGWLTPLGPFLTIISSGMAIIFLSWDNTDLLPARRVLPFKERFRFLFKTISFHLGFGSLFLIPGINILFLSFAPVGATLYLLEGTHSIDISS